ncbi:hypothetical protein B0H19DRAFT_1235581 [Mycena capillaripes]|nr:hypothetical protein B0H19DRAFT_1235581 [Mycena capillaripes]
MDKITESNIETLPDEDLSGILKLVANWWRICLLLNSEEGKKRTGTTSNYGMSQYNYGITTDYGSRLRPFLELWTTIRIAEELLAMGVPVHRALWIPHTRHQHQSRGVERCVGARYSGAVFAISSLDIDYSKLFSSTTMMAFAKYSVQRLVRNFAPFSLRISFYWQYCHEILGGFENITEVFSIPNLECLEILGGFTGKYATEIRDMHIEQFTLRPLHNGECLTLRPAPSIRWLCGRPSAALLDNVTGGDYGFYVDDVDGHVVDLNTLSVRTTSAADRRTDLSIEHQGGGEGEGNAEGDARAAKKGFQNGQGGPKREA